MSEYRRNQIRYGIAFVVITAICFAVTLVSAPQTDWPLYLAGWAVALISVGLALSHPSLWLLAPFGALGGAILVRAGTDGLDDVYVAPADELAQIPHTGQSVTVRDAINHLCDVVAEKHDEALEVGRYPTEEIDDDNRVSATPIDKVYEHGFYPLDGGFRATPGTEGFQVFDQWVEVLPTDQVVPVEVAYDPKTGWQI